MTESKGLTRAHWMVLIAAFAGWMFVGVEMGLFPIMARPALQDLMGVTSDKEVGRWNGYIVAMFLLGAASGGFVFGWLGDRLGRVRTMILAILTYSFFTGCGYFATAPWHLGVLRFLAGVGMGGEWALGVALVMECWPEKLRPLLAGVIGASANVGFLLIALVGCVIEITVDSWRWMFLVGALPAALVTIYIWICVPESERWKESVKKSKSHPVREIFTTRLLKPTLLAIAFASVALIGTWGAVSGFLPLWTDKLAGGLSELTITAEVADPAPGAVAIAIDPAAVRQAGTGGPVYVLKKTGSFREAPGPGEEFSYTVRIANTGEKAGSGVTFTDVLPIKAIDPGSVRPEDEDHCEFEAESGKFRWDVGALPAADPPAEAVLTITMKVAEYPRSSIDASANRARVTDDGKGGVPFVHAVKENLTLKGDPEPKEKFRCTLSVSNKVDRTADGVTVTGRVPLDQVDPKSVTFNREGVEFKADTGQFTWSSEPIEPKNPRAASINQVVISIGAIIGCLVGPLIGGWMGRRPAYFLLCLSSLLVCQFIFRMLSAYDLTFILAAGVAGCVTASFYGWLPLYLPELFPTRVRATGQGLSFNFGRILAVFGAISAGQLVLLFEGIHPGEGYARSGALITLVYLVGMGLIWLAPETKGKPLPE